MSALSRTWPERSAAVLDIGLLPTRDRAWLRPLDRYEAAKAGHPAVLVHPSRRTSLRGQRHAWRIMTRAWRACGVSAGAGVGRPAPAPCRGFALESATRNDGTASVSVVFS